MGLFKKIPYHLPFYTCYSRLGEWSWNDAANQWVLHLNPKSKNYLDLQLTHHFRRFQDDRVKYSHLSGPGFDPESLIGAWLKVSGSDGREYLWEKLSEYWREEMNKGKRCEPKCDFPVAVSNLKIRADDAKNPWHPANR